MSTDLTGLKDEQRKFWKARNIIKINDSFRFKRWIQLLIFYMTFYFVLSLLTSFMFLIFYQMIDQRAPVLRNGESALGNLIYKKK
jgi:hypothetical protein